MDATDVIALLALLLSVMSAGWTWHHREQARPDREHKALERQVMNAQIQDRDSAAEALRRQIQARSINLGTFVQGLADRIPTPDGVRGAALCQDADADKLLELSSQVDDEAAHLAADAANALSQIAGMVRPHLLKDPRMPAVPFGREQLTAAISDVKIALIGLAAIMERNARVPPQAKPGFAGDAGPSILSDSEFGLAMRP